MLGVVEAIPPEYFKKKTKSRVKKNVDFILQRKQHATPKSEVTKIVEDLIKKNITEYESVKNYLSERFDNMPNSTVSLYHMLVSTRVVNGAVNLTDKITNKKLKRHAILLDQYCQAFSNDRLVIENLYVDLTGILAKSSEIDASYSDCCDVKSCLVVSPSFLFEGTCKKGYYQDFDENFAAIAVDQLSDEDQKKILTFNEELFIRDFEFRNITYNVYAKDIACVIASKKIVEERLGENLYKKMITFHDGKKFALDVKSFELKKKVKYVNMLMHPEEFCPAFLILPKGIHVNIMFTAEFNYNELYENVTTRASKNKGDLQLPSNLFYWDQMTECMDFLGIIALIPNNGVSELDKKNLATYYDNYRILKPILSVIGSIKLKCVACLKEFYNSFTTKINFDKLSNLQKKIVLLKDDLARIQNAEHYGPATRFIKALNEMYKIAGYCENQFSDEFTSTLDYVDKAVQDLVDAKSGNIINDLKKISERIYFLTPCGEKGCKPCFPWLFSLGAHLGALTYDLIDPSIVTAKIDRYAEKVTEKKEAEKLATKTMEDIVNNLATHQHKLIVNTINNYDTVKKLSLSPEIKFNLAKKLVEHIKGNDDFRNLINKNIIEVIKTKGGITTEYIDKIDYLDTLLSEKKTIEKVEKLKKEKDKLDKKIKKETDKIGYGYDDDEEMIDDEDTSKLKDPETSSLMSFLSTYSVSTTDSLGILEDAMKYLLGKNKDFTIASKDMSKKTRKNAKLDHWVRTLLSASNVYGFTSALDEKLKDKRAKDLLKTYPLALSVVDEVLRAGLVPNLKDYLLLDTNEMIPQKKLGITQSTMAKRNADAIKNSEPYLPKHFFSGEDLGV